MDNFVSIIVPVYNTVEYVEECIQSILSQSYKNIELILVNDGSTDGAGEICKRYEHLPNVKYVEQENEGATSARKRGVRESQGDWIMFVDSDDFLLEKAVKDMINLADETDIVIGAHTRNIQQIGKLPNIIEQSQYLQLIYTRELYVAPFGRLFRKALFNENTLAFPKYYVLGEDYLMNLQIALDNKKGIRVCHSPIYERRLNPTSTMHTYPLSLDYCQRICGLADEMVRGAFEDKWPLLQMKQRMMFFLLTLPDTQYRSDSHHPFVKDIKRCMNEAKVWRPMDRWLLSVSSPCTVKTVWNLRKVTRRLAHPSMIPRDIKRLLNR